MTMLVVSDLHANPFALEPGRDDRSKPDVGRERALERFEAPQDPIEMVTFGETKIASEYFQVRVGGDVAAPRPRRRRGLAAGRGLHLPADRAGGGVVAALTHGLPRVSRMVAGGTARGPRRGNPLPVRLRCLLGNIISVRTTRQLRS